MVKHLWLSVGGYGLEFPTDLIADNESPEAPALWELKEETDNKRWYWLFSSCWYGSKVVNGTTYIVTITINGKDAENVKL